MLILGGVIMPICLPLLHPFLQGSIEQTKLPLCMQQRVAAALASIAKD